jgi:cytidyltransferase-like protein
MKIGLVPISAKPYHAGHHYLVEKASSQNEKVIVYVSTSDRIKDGEFPIRGSVMKKIWAEHLLKIMPENVEIDFGGSPVRKVYEFVGSACEDLNLTDEITIYSDNEDTQSNYPIDQREKYMNPLYTANKVLFAAEVLPESFTRGGDAPNIRATMLRQCLMERNFVDFASRLPRQVNAYSIWDELLKAESL